jgi:hypothetical protein
MALGEDGSVEARISVCAERDEVYVHQPRSQERVGNGCERLVSGCQTVCMARKKRMKRTGDSGITPSHL